MTPSARRTALSHAEPHSMDGLDGVSGAADFDVGRALTPKEVEQQLARHSREARSRLSSTRAQDLGRPQPLELEQRWSLGAELGHEVAQPFAFDGVQGSVSHRGEHNRPKPRPNRAPGDLSGGRAGSQWW